MKGIVLVGFMGTGKTEVARALAGRLRWPWVDTDQWIEQAADKTIARIFAEDGEPVFRERETRALQELVRESESRVIATGGGIVLAEANWPLLRALGDVAGLTAEAEEILRRVEKADTRPLLAGSSEDVQTRVRDLLERRRSAYARADAMFATDGLTSAEVAENILRWRETRSGV